MARTVRAKPDSQKTPGAGRRRIGRPSNAAPGVGREALISATCELLAKLPADQVTRALVARTLNVDPSLIRYYFKDRTSLLAAAAERMTEEYSRILEERLPRSDQSAVGRLATRLDALIDFNAQYPFFHHLLFNELLNSPSPAANQMLDRLNKRAVAGYAEILREGVEAGELKAVDPELAFVALITMSSFFTGVINLLRLNERPDFDPAEFTQRYREFLLDLIANGLGRRPA